MKPPKPFIFILFTLFIFNSHIAYAIPTDTEYIASDKYFDKALSEINISKTSIYLVMYLISITPDQPQSQPSQLVYALINAKSRGIDVKVILDQNINFESDNLDDAHQSNKNQTSYELLKKNNVSVYFDESQTFTHSKVLVIDNKTVLLGSTNWSKSAFTRNHETNVLIRSEDLAKQITANLNQIKLQVNIPAILTPSVAIPKDFIQSKKQLGEIATHSDERALDTYLYLLKEFNQNKDSTLTLNYDHLALSLGISKMSTEDYRRQINKVLIKLKDKYNLLDFTTPNRNQSAEIKLITPKDQTYTNIPTLYWKHNWNQQLSFSGKVMYLILLDYSESSPSGSISISREQISKDHNISESFISDGTKTLRKLNLLDIKYSDLEDLRFNLRQPSIYTLRELYNPQDLKKDISNLEQKHGKDKLSRAIITATLAFEENNLQTIQTLIDLENKYGQDIIKEAAKKISEKNPDNPKRSAGYLINTIKSMGKDTV